LWRTAEPRLAVGTLQHVEEVLMRAPLLVVGVLALAGCTVSGPPAPSPTTPAVTSPALTTPTLAAWHALVYHARLRMTVLVNGGPEANGVAEAPLQLWGWNGTAWRQLSGAGPRQPDEPRWRNFASVAYDADRGVLVLHGGLQGRGRPLDETWEWDGQRWAGFSGAAPGGREGAGMAYDAARKLTVLVGGADGERVRSDTWGWNGTTWRKLAETGPSPRFPGLVAYDPPRSAIVLYGGHSVDAPPPILGDTWLWDGQTWHRAAEQSPPGPRVNTAGAFHARLGQLIMVAGGGEKSILDDIWAWSGSAWTRLPDSGLPPREASGLAYDAARDRLVLTGGLLEPGQPGRRQDVWEWDGTRFAEVHPS
jgi:hypothetical protein